jgi:hypothetical protein
VRKVTIDCFVWKADSSWLDISMLDGCHHGIFAEHMTGSFIAIRKRPWDLRQEPVIDPYAGTPLKAPWQNREIYLEVLTYRENEAKIERENRVYHG